MRVINHLKEKIPELFLELVEILALDRISDFVSFFDRVGRDGGKSLGNIPKTARLLVAQTRHNAEKVVERKIGRAHV